MVPADNTRPNKRYDADRSQLQSLRRGAEKFSTLRDTVEVFEVIKIIVKYVVIVSTAC